MNRNTHQKDFRVTRHRKYPRWGRLAKTKDYRRCPWGYLHIHPREMKDRGYWTPRRVLMAAAIVKEQIEL